MEKEITIESQNIKQERILGIEFARACCAIGIIIVHYFSHSAGSFKFLYQTANCPWGSLFVTVFFAISGAVLYYNYPKIESLKPFYFKRWKSIFPAFYLCSLFFYLLNSILKHNFLYAGNPLKFLLTIFGIDGYFYYRIYSYYQVGEWFLGAIIMLYLLYPLLSSLMNKNLFIVPYILILGYIWMYFTDFFVINKFSNLITCISSFYIGMLTIKYKDFFFKNHIVGILSFLTFILLRFIKLPEFILFYQIQGFSLLIVLVQIGDFIMQTKLNKIFKSLSKLSFCIFLFQHNVIFLIFKFYNPEEWYKILITLLATIVITVICAKVLSIITDFLLKTKIFKKFESKIID